jgi:hypothetical protein
MREIIKYSIGDIIPERDAVLKGQGIPSNVNLPDNILMLADRSLGIFREICDPAGIISEVSKLDFGIIYAGERRNENLTPVEEIYPRADFVALFAVTVGERVSRRISALFDSGDFALGTMLDAAASEATEKAGIYTEKYYLDYLVRRGNISGDMAVMRYSPGYCGWHISGQKKLFEFLNPGDIGISLTDSFLMQPLKSISGVMIVGAREIHNFDMSYSFCEECRDQGCRERIKALFGN